MDIAHTAILNIANTAKEESIFKILKSSRFKDTISELSKK
jgi:hypothetical protein